MCLWDRFWFHFYWEISSCQVRLEVGIPFALSWAEFSNSQIMLFLGLAHESCNLSHAGINQCCTLCRQHKTKFDLAPSNPQSDVAFKRPSVCLCLVCLGLMCFHKHRVPNLNEGSTESQATCFGPVRSWSRMWSGFPDEGTTTNLQLFVYALYSSFHLCIVCNMSIQSHLSIDLIVS